MVSALINAGEQSYVEDRNLFYFTLDTQAVSASGQIAQMKVDTDVSLMPYTEIFTEYFVAVPEQFIAQTIPILNNVYAEVSFSKAATYPVYTRSFSKVDDYLSYVGGLVSTVILLFFVFSAYSALAYCLEIASSAFVISPGKPVSANSFNFLHFLLLCLKDVMSLCKV